MFIFLGIHLLRSKYVDILRLLPSDYMESIQILQDHITHDQLCRILSTNNCNIVNQLLLDYLIENFKSSNILYLCDQLEKILPSTLDPVEFYKIIEEIRSRFYACLCMYRSSVCTCIHHM